MLLSIDVMRRKRTFMKSTALKKSARLSQQNVVPVTKRIMFRFLAHLLTKYAACSVN